MKKITHYVTTLIIARITGSITKHEEILLNNLLEEFPQVRALSDFLNETLSPVDVRDEAVLEQEARNILKMAKARTDVMPVSHAEPKTMKYFGLAAVAACLIVIIVIGVRLGGYHNPRQQSINAGRKDSASVSLLIGGDTVLLTGKKLTIHPDKGLLIDDTYPLRALKNSEKDLIATLRVPAGQRYALELSDRSEVSINSATELKFPIHFKERERLVNVNGEAYFTVDADASRPFIVQLPNSEVKALGTQFNVKSYDEHHPRIALISGSARVTSGHNVTLLQPGEVATRSGNLLEVGSMDKDEIGWLQGEQGEIYVHDASEKEIVDITWGYWGKKLTIETSSPLQDNLINLIIDTNQPIDSFLIQLAPLDKIHQDSNGYRIER